MENIGKSLVWLMYNLSDLHLEFGLRDHPCLFMMQPRQYVNNGIPATAGMYASWCLAVVCSSYDNLECCGVQLTA